MDVCASSAITITHHCARRATREEMEYYLYNHIWSLEFRGLTSSRDHQSNAFRGCLVGTDGVGGGFTIKVMAHRKEPQILKMKLCRSPTLRDRWRDKQGGEQLNGARTSFPVICSSVNGINFAHRRADQWMFVFPPRLKITHHCARRATREEITYYLHNRIWI
ncbi:hypothetical protein CEXT_159811 [Caerostris extrusa]|uniref:Uncharacterized protein n=1 Tax=Caerostris extrusa TaxID=172846 RepID=A0AAV4TQK2_CAEEX|nr:hypothetical protein CEXT_159811 [Caerostris extrusa]